LTLPAKGLLLPYPLKKRNEFKIGFQGLKDGDHDFEYRIKEAFFLAFDSEVGQGADIEVNVLMEKKSNMLTLSVDFQGELAFDCDRCNEPCDIGIEGKHTLYYKFTNDDGSEDDDVYFIGPQDMEIDISRPLYEYIILSIPARRVHEEGECNPDVIAALENEPDVSDEGTDPRWDALKKLK